MSNQQDFEEDRRQVYEIRLQGHLDRKWMGWFEGLVMVVEADGNTLLTGPVVDQAALHGLLKKVRDLGMVLLSVRIIGRGSQNKTGEVSHE